MLIDGIHVPLTVPFARDGGIYLRKLESNVGRYSLSPVAGLVALGPGSEAGALSEDETREVLRVVGQTAGAEKVLLAGIASESVRISLAIADEAAKAGFDAVLLGAPLCWPEVARGNAGLNLFFAAIADASPLPVMLWSDASAPSMSLPVELIGELAAHPNVIGLYDADLTVDRFREVARMTAGVSREVKVTTVFAPVTRRMEAAAREDGTFVPAEALGSGGALTVTAKPAMKTRVKTVGFQVMTAGSCGEMLPLLEAGVAGAMPRLAACAPQGCYEVFAAFKDGNPALSAEKADRVREADEAMRSLGIAGVKHGCDWNGYYGGLPRLPRLPLNAEKRTAVETLLGEVRN